MASMFKLPGQQVVDANGNPYSGARLYFFDAGTSTPKDVYSDAALTTPLSQPVSADSAGRWVPIFTQSSTYRVELRTSADVLIANWDNFDPGSPVTTGGGGALSIALGGTGATTAAGARSNLGITFDGAWTDVASAATVDLGAQSSDNLRITGTTTITSFGTAASGVTRNLRFAGALTLTHNATSLILPGGANIVTAAGDTAMAISLGSGNWVVVNFERAGGIGVYGGAQGDIIYRAASAWARLSAGVNGQVLTTQGAGADPIWSAVTAGLTNAAQVTASGASFAVTGIPASAKLILISARGFSSTNSSGFIFYIGDSGGLETTGYTGIRTEYTNVPAISITTNTTELHSQTIIASVASGIVNIILWKNSATTDRWAGRWDYFQEAAEQSFGFFEKTLSATLDRVGFATTAGTFDAGTVDVTYI